MYIKKELEGKEEDVIRLNDTDNGSLKRI